MKPTRKIRVLIADDHPVVREGLCGLIGRQEDMEVVAEAANGRETLDLYVLHDPDVTLIDLRMPEMTGIETIAAVRKIFPAAKTIMLTTYSGDEDVYQSLRAGAKAYLLKDAPREELLGCIRAVHSGKTWISGEAAANLATRMGASPLRARELDVLCLMATGKSNKEIGTALFITEGTVKVHVNRILQKLGASGRTEAVLQAAKRGIVRLD